MCSPCFQENHNIVRKERKQVIYKLVGACGVYVLFKSCCLLRFTWNLLKVLFRQRWQFVRILLGFFFSGLTGEGKKSKTFCSDYVAR